MRRSLMFPLLAVTGSLAAAVGSLPSHADEPEHPLIGTWTWTPEGTDCKEVYQWRSNHTGHVVSGEEVTETKFQVAKEPDENGFYVFIDTVTKDNKGKDCAGSKKDDTGTRTTLYIQVHPSGKLIRICTKPSEDSCFGPLMREPELSI